MMWGTILSTELKAVHFIMLYRLHDVFTLKTMVNIKKVVTLKL